MRTNNLFFYAGEGLMENQQIMLDKESTVNVIDADNEFMVQKVKKIDIKLVDKDKIKITLGPQVTLVSSNTKIVVNMLKDMVCIEMLNSEDKLAEYTSIVNAQEARGLINYIMECTPDLYSIEALLTQPIDELRKLKESMDDYANCY